MNPRDVILQMIYENPGINGVKIITNTMHVLYKETSLPCDVDVVELLNEMATQGEIVEVEYVIPSADYRIKSLYFPLGTKVKTTAASF